MMAAIARASEQRTGAEAPGRRARNSEIPQQAQNQRLRTLRGPPARL